MSYPGDYPQPLVRPTFAQAPIISGYVTIRLRATDTTNLPAISGTPDLALFTFDNQSTTTIGFKVQQTNDRSISGTRLDVISGVITLVPGGQTTVQGSPIQAYLEILGQQGPGYLRMQLNSQRKWAELGFDKSDPFYPPQLFQGKTVPGPL